MLAANAQGRENIASVWRQLSAARVHRSGTHPYRQASRRPRAIEQHCAWHITLSLATYISNAVVSVGTHTCCLRTFPPIQNISSYTGSHQELEPLLLT